MTVVEPFPPLRETVAYAKTWGTYLRTCRDELATPHAKEIVARAENCVRIGVMLGELLPITWRGVFHALFRPLSGAWKPVVEFEALRQEVRALFFTVRESMEGANEVARRLQKLTGRRLSEADQLDGLLDAARRLEDAVFQDWPSFAEQSAALPKSAGSLPVDESLAEALGVTVEAARERLAARRRELDASQ